MFSKRIFENCNFFKITLYETINQNKPSTLCTKIINIIFYYHHLNRFGYVYFTIRVEIFSGFNERLIVFSKRIFESCNFFQIALYETVNQNKPSTLCTKIINIIFYYHHLNRFGYVYFTIRVELGLQESASLFLFFF